MDQMESTVVNVIPDELNCKKSFDGFEKNENKEAVFSTPRSHELGKSIGKKRKFTGQSGQKIVNKKVKHEGDEILENELSEETGLKSEPSSALSGCQLARGNLENDKHFKQFFRNCLLLVANRLETNWLNKFTYCCSMENSMRMVITVHIQVQNRQQLPGSSVHTIVVCQHKNESRVGSVIFKHNGVVENHDFTRNRDLNDENWWNKKVDDLFFLIPCVGIEVDLKTTAFSKIFKFIEDFSIFAEFGKIFPLFHDDVEVGTFELTGHSAGILRASSCNCLTIEGQRCSHCSFVKKKYVDIGNDDNHGIILDISKKMRTYLNDNEEIQNKWKEFSSEREFLKNPLVSLLVDVIRDDKLKEDAFLYSFLYVQLQVLLKSSPNGIRWTGDSRFEKVFQFFCQLYNYTMEKGYYNIVGDQWKKINGSNVFTGNLISPSTAVIKKVLKLYSYGPGVQEKPLFLMKQILKNLKASGSLRMSLSADEMHLRKGLVRSCKDGKTCWKGMFVFDDKWVLQHVLKDSDACDGADEEDDESSGSIVVENVDVDENVTEENIVKIREGLKNEINKLKKNDGKLISRVLQFMGRMSLKKIDDEGKEEVVNLRIPLFYFPSVGVNADFAKVCILSSIQFINEYFEEHSKDIGIHDCFVDALCFDGDKGVAKFIQSFGVVEKGEDLAHYFLMGDRKVFFIPDFGHLIKCIRRDMLDPNKLIFFPSKDAENNHVLGSVSRLHFWKLLYKEHLRLGPSFSGLTFLHLKAKGTASMKQKFSSDFFKKRCIDALHANADEEFVAGTLGFLQFFKRMSSVFKSKFPIREDNDWRITECESLLSGFRGWKEAIKFGIKKKLISGTIKSAFINYSNEEKIVISLKGILGLIKSREGVAVVIPYEVGSSDDIENLFNLHRHSCGKGSDNAVNYSNYELDTGAVMINRWTKYMSKGGSYEYVELFKNNDNLFNGKVQEVLKEMDAINANCEQINISVFDTVNDMFTCCPIVRAWSPKGDSEWNQLNHFVGAALVKTRKEFIKRGKNGIKFLILVDELLKKGGNRLTKHPKYKELTEFFLHVFQHFYFNVGHEHSLQTLLNFEDNFTRFVTYIMRTEKANLIKKLSAKKELDGYSESDFDVILDLTIKKLIMSANKKQMSVKNLLPEKFKKSFRQENEKKGK